VTHSVAAPGVTHPSDATATQLKIKVDCVAVASSLSKPDEMRVRDGRIGLLSRNHLAVFRGVDHLQALLASLVIRLLSSCRCARITSASFAL